MKYCEFYKEPKASLLFNSPIILAEMGARNCYESFHAMDIDILKAFDCDGAKEFHKALQIDDRELNVEWVRFTNYFFDKDFDNKEYKELKTYFLTKLMEYNPERIIKYAKPNTKFIRSIALENGHDSTIEHVNLTFRLEMPRNVLQELSRHRLGISPSVKSTRYTLTTLIKAFKRYVKYFEDHGEGGMYEDIYKKRFQESMGVLDIDIQDIDFEGFTKKLMILSRKGITLKNDIVKNVITEHWWCNGQYTMNLRALTNLFNLRLDGSAFLPFRMLAHNIYMALPDVFKSVYKEDYDANIKGIEEIWNSEIK